MELSARLPSVPGLPSLVLEIDEGDRMFEGSLEHYRDVGSSALTQIERALRGFPEPERILDLACGHGRVTRFLRARFPSAEITGCDVDEAAIAFVARAFGAKPLRSEADFARFDIGSAFDLVWIGSLVTHLPEYQTRALLDFLDRHLAPSGTVVLTSHGAFVEKRLLTWNYGLPDEAVRGLLADCRMAGYAYRPYPGSLGYGISLARREWFLQTVPEGSFRLEAYRERAWDRHQDVVVLRRPKTRRRPLDRFRRPALRRYGGACVEPPANERQERMDAESVGGFDEEWYLRTYADVAEALRRGDVSSGLRHFQTWGWREGREPGDPALSFAARSERIGRSGKDRVETVWSEDEDERVEQTGWYWMAHPLVRERLNRLASGDPMSDAYDRLAMIVRGSGSPLPIGNALSLGCGFGALERDLVVRDIVDRIEGTDIATGAISEARRRATEAGLARITYRVADLDRERLRRDAFDVVFGHQSIHHVEALERLFEQVSAALRPNGLFHLHEFIGPTRFQWTDEQLALVNDFLSSLPEPLRRLPSGDAKPFQTRPTIDAMLAADPSESVRSAEIPAVLDRYFEIVERRDLGGAVLHLALGGIAQNFETGNPDHEKRLRDLFAVEDGAMEDGSIGSDFVTLLARPRAHASVR